MPRLFRIGGSFAIVLTVYWTYALLAVPLIEPTQKALRRMVVWSHPALANRCVYARNDREIVCADLSADR